MPVDAALRRLVCQRAGDRCEYCGLHQSELPLVTFHVDHVIARQHGGTDDESNRSLCCHWCNFKKGPNLSTRIDGQTVTLFNPRTQIWADHFARQGDLIVGLTPIGRGTVRLLDMNDEDRRQIRTTHSADTL
jgi:hypothetical protein